MGDSLGVTAAEKGTEGTPFRDWKVWAGSGL